MTNITLNTASTSARNALNDYLNSLDCDEIAVAEWEYDKEIEQEILFARAERNALRSLDPNSAEYWDVFKEVYGIRPRW